jgi:preprotein translocase subunit SecE
MTYHSVFDVPRNNLQAAVVFLDAHWGKLRPEDIATLFRLQDDPTKLERLLAEMERHYRRPPVSRGGTSQRHGAVLRVGQQALPNWFRAIRTRDQKVVWVNRQRFLANPHKYHLPKEGPIPRGHHPPLLPQPPPVVEPPGQAPEPPKPEPPKPEEQPPVVEPPGKAQWFKAIRKRDGKVIWVTREQFKAHPELYELRRKPEPEERKPREKQPPEEPPEAKQPLTQEFLQQQVRTLHRALNVYPTTTRNEWTGKVEHHLPTAVQAEIRGSVASILERVGLYNHVGHGTGYQPTGSKQYVIKDDLGDADAMHGWDGRVAVLTQVHQQAQRFFANPATASREDVNGGRVLLHEETHNHCPMHRGAYEGRVRSSRRPPPRFWRSTSWWSTSSANPRSAPTIGSARS